MRTDLSLIDKVDQALDTIRPYLQEDGGDVRIVAVENEQVEVELLGSCADCPMSNMTMKAGIEDAIIKAVPEIKKVLAVQPE